MENMLFLTALISFFITLIVLPKWIKKCHQVGMLWEDMNKYKHPKNVAASGGIVVVMAFVISVLSYVAIRTFVLGDMNGITIKIFSLLAVVLILALVGLTDDLLGWKHGGLSKRARVVLAIIASIPLVVINAGSHIINLPVFGEVSLGILYPLLLIPLGITGAATTFNFLAGFNGLEAGQGVIIISFLSLIAYITGSSWLALIGLIMVASLIVFYFFNKYPAKVFPGDILTYSVGAMIAGMAILGNFEKIALFVFIPYMLEVALKLRGNLKVQSFGIPDKDGSLEMPHEKVYGLTHFAIFVLKRFKKNVSESDVVYFIFSIQIIICLLALLIFRSFLFS
jgi:UDP-N-acetylglucosamine--dolichyl-phosphate N-acetylglucosaminephosphotransferase